MLKTKSTIRWALFIMTTTLVSLYISGCSDDSSDGAGTTAGFDGAFNGPGSSWNMNLSANNTFVVTRAPSVGAAVDLTVNGTYETLSSGYLRLTVTTATGTDAPAAGVQAYGLNIPGLAFLLKPMSNDGEIIPMVVSGTCPTSTTDFNWVVSSHEASGDGSTNLTTGRDLTGTASFNGSDTLTISAKYDLGGNSLSAGDALTGSCSNGIINLPGTADLYLSTSGAAIVGTAAGTTILAMPQQTLTMADLDGEYIGLVFNENVNPGTQAQVEPHWLTMDSSGTTEANSWTNVVAGTKETTGNLTFSGITANSPSNGFFRMTVSDGGNTAPMTCQGAVNVASSGKNMIFCVGVDPSEYNGGSGIGDELFSVLMVSQ